MTEITRIYAKKLLESSKSKGILALDLGMKKVGVAIAEYGINLALPVSVIGYKRIPILLEELARIIEGRNIALIVVGAVDIGGNSPYKKLIKALEEFELPVCFEDEAYTTSIANQMLKEHGISRRKRNAIDDMVAAQLILQSFLDKVTTRKTITVISSAENSIIC